jgi:hypothetical protein
MTDAVEGLEARPGAPTTAAAVGGPGTSYDALDTATGKEGIAPSCRPSDPSRRQTSGYCASCGPDKPPMLLYDVARESLEPLLYLDPSTHLAELDCLYLIVGLLSAHYHIHETEVLVALLPWTTACLGSKVLVGGPPPTPGHELRSRPASYAPQTASSLHVMLLAPSGCGKSTLVNDLVAKFSGVFGSGGAGGGAGPGGPGVHSGSSPPALIAHLKASGGASMSATDEAWSLYGDFLGKSGKGAGAAAADGDLLNK